MTSATLLAEHLVWEATSKEAANQAFNVVNGDVFKWKFLWKKIAEYFGMEEAPYPGGATLMQTQMKGMDSAWDEIVKKYDLKPFKMTDLAPWWHVDLDLNRGDGVVSSMTKSRKLGFLGWRDSEETIFELFQQLEENKIIPKRK